MASGFIKDPQTGKVYKMGSGGYYQPYTPEGNTNFYRTGNDIYKKDASGGLGYVGDPNAVDWGDVTNFDMPNAESSSIADVYSKQAKAETDPYYNAQATTATQDTAATQASTADRLKALYTDTGMGLSSFSDSAQAANTIQNNRSLASRMADIEKARTGEYQTRVGNLQSRQFTGEQQDFQAEQNRLAAIEAQKQRDAQMALLNAQISSYKSGSGAGATASTTAKPNLSQAMATLGQIFSQEGGGQWFVDPSTGQRMTREQAGQDVASQTGIPYQSVMKTIYNLFK